MKNKNYKMKKIINKQTFDYIVGIFTVLSVVLVYYTLREMQIERNNAYMPVMVAETRDVTIWWGDQKKVVKNNPLMKEKNMSSNPSAIPMTVYNIGVGVAKNMNVKIDSSCIDEMIEYLNKYDSKNTYKYEKGKDISQIYINNKSEFVFTSNENLYKRMYLLPNAEENFDFFIPTHITILVKKVYEVFTKQNGEEPDLHIKLNFEYNDVQGLKYKRTIDLNFVCSLFMDNKSEGYGYFVYSIMPNDN